MVLNIIVCIKQVPHPEHFAKVSLDPVRQTIIREGIPAIINPLDKHALEEGLKLREKFSGRVTVISMGPPQAKASLEETLAIGADDAVLLCDKAFAGADTLATAYGLASGIKKLGQFDLVICGNNTIDSGTGQVGPQLAEILNIPHASYVKNVAFALDGKLIVMSQLERGYMKMAVRLPVLLSVVKGINQPRLPTIWGIMGAKNKEIRIWSAADVGAELGVIGLAGSTTQVLDIVKNEVKRRREILKGSPAVIVKESLTRLQELQAL